MASLGERRGGENKEEGPEKMGLGLGDLGGPSWEGLVATSFVNFYFSYYKIECNAKAAMNGKKEAELNN